MILSLDWETYKGIEYPSRRNAFLGALTDEKKQTQFFYKGKDMWNHILKVGKKLNSHGKTLFVYAYNMRDFDWYCFGDRRCKTLIDKSDNFFMKVIKETDKERLTRLNKCNGKGSKSNREYIVFLDFMAITARMSSIGNYRGLKGVGELINFPKLEPPEYLNNITRKLIKNNPLYLEELKVYCKRDSDIIIEAYNKIKTELELSGINIRNYYSVSGIAIKVLINFLKKHPDGKNLFRLNKWGVPEFYPSVNRLEVEDEFSHKMPFARGGRVQTLKTGKFKECIKIDKNGYYQWASSHIRIPDLKSESKIKTPLKVMSKEYLLNMIGVSKCMVKIPNNIDIGFLQVRDKGIAGNPNVFPTKGILIGQWTHDELVYAESIGYEIMDIEFSIIWQDLVYKEHPFKAFNKWCYGKRKEGGEFKEWLYKMIGNGYTGKMNQYLPKVELVRVNYTKHLELLDKGWTISSTDGPIFVMKNKGEFILKPYYAPIIYALITAKARIN